jgi:hypothetical protein
MAKYTQGIFVPKNPQKYVGRGSIKFRSSWELAFFHFLDNHPNITQWASESIRIPYRNPLTGKNTTYVPDVFMVYIDANGQTHAELIEIKPSKETTMESAKSRHDVAMVAINMAKWTAARAFCANKNITFRVVTENDLWRSGK